MPETNAAADITAAWAASRAAASFLGQLALSVQRANPTYKGQQRLAGGETTGLHAETERALKGRQSAPAPPGRTAWKIGCAGGLTTEAAEGTRGDWEGGRAG